MTNLQPPASGTDSNHSASCLPVTYADVVAAGERLVGQAHQTPVVTSRTLNQRTDSQIFFKCENWQRTGSFKFRGAYNALAQLSPAERQSGVLTYSSGNHAQAIALAGQLLKIPTTVIMPQDAPQVKLAAVREYGTHLVLYNPLTTTREALAEQLVRDQGLTLIPPFDHPWVVAGQGTVALELLQQVGELDVLLVCCGGGGLLSGCAIATRTLRPNCQIIGVEPKRADDATRSFYSGTLQRVERPETVADGARTASLGQITFPLVLEYVDQMVTVSEAAIIRSMMLLWERLKLVVEPTGALAAAALLEGVVTAPGGRVGVILSGGNVDLKQASKLFAKATTKERPARRLPLAQELS